MRTAIVVCVLLASACNRAPDEPHAAPGPGALPAPPPPPAPAPTAPAAPGASAEGRPARISARHVLVMHRGSERVPPTVTRTQAEARTRAEDVLRRARAGEDFAGLARQFSDEPGAAQSGGDLGSFGPGQMVPAFEQAAFALPVGGTSGIVETPFGYHVIRRTQ